MTFFKGVLSVISLTLFTTNLYAAEITVAAGSIMKNAHGEVVTKGKVFAIERSLTSYSDAVVSSGIPRNIKDLVRVLESPSAPSFDSSVGNVSIINDRILLLKEIYGQIKRESIEDNKLNAVQRIKQTNAYIREMEEVKRLQQIQDSYRQKVGPIEKELATLQSEYDALYKELNALDDEFMTKANAFISNQSANPKLLSKLPGKVKYLKFKKGKINKKSGACPEIKRKYVIDRRSTFNHCFVWSVAAAWRDYLPQLGELASKYVDRYYEINKKLEGKSRKDKSSLRFRIKAKDKELDIAYKNFKQNHPVGSWSQSGLKKQFRYAQATEQKWLRQIEQAKNATFNPAESSRFDMSIREPYLIALRAYYNSVASEIMDDAVVDSKEIYDFKFQAEAAAYYAIFVDIQAPVQKENFGIIVDADASGQLMAHQYSSNTLVTGFSSDRGDTDYVVAVLIYLLDRTE